MANNAQIFALSLERWSQKTGERTLTMFKALAMQGIRRLVLRSPVRTGRFRGNWNIGMGVIDASTTKNVDLGGQITIARAIAVLGALANLRLSLFLTNSLPYARPIEYGSSKQAPSGVVRPVVIELGGPEVAAEAVAKALQGLFV